MNVESVKAAPKARKGDYVVVQESSRIFYALGSGRENETRTTWHVARVESATRDGLAKTVKLYEGDFPHDCGRFKYRVFTIASKQTEASKLFPPSYPPAEYASESEIRDAILSAC